MAGEELASVRAEAQSDAARLGLAAAAAEERAEEEYARKGSLTPD